MGKSARTRLVTGLVLMAVFSSGLLLGLAADSALVATPVATAVLVDVKEPGRHIPLYAQVGADPAQGLRIDSIVVEHRARMDSLHEVFREAYDPPFKAIVGETRAAIKQILTREQAARYDALTEERDRLAGRSGGRR